MKAHLEEERISSWMLGDRTAVEEEHVRGCPACQEELARMARALAQFRDAVHAAGETPRQPAVKPAATYHGHWALAALILIAAVLPIYKGVEERRRAEAARADALLLEQVDASVSRAIAAPMEPLAKLMQWEGNRKNEGIR